MVIVAAPDFQPASFTALLAQARAQPDHYMVGSSAPAFDLSLQLLQSSAKVKLRSVPYPGTPQAAVDVIGGRIPLMVDSIGGAAAQIKAGKLKPLAVLDSRRSAILPDVPTVAESGVEGYESVGWVAVVAPKGTPPEIVDRLNAHLQEIVALPSMRSRLETLGFEPAAGSAVDLGTLIVTEHGKWGTVVKNAGLRNP
jgi:tripartite-type tricarboxylate transporter receptor subunit TctC